MTTKVLIVNFGPDPVLVRTVQHSVENIAADVPPKVLADTIIQPTGCMDFYVHDHQQLLVGEKRGAVPTGGSPT